MELGLFISRKAFFYYPAPGQPVQVLPGMVAAEGHPVIEAEPSAWEPLKVAFEVEKKADKAEPEATDSKAAETEAPKEPEQKATPKEPTRKAPERGTRRS
jgi:hypothetical protein